MTNGRYCYPATQDELSIGNENHPMHVVVISFVCRIPRFGLALMRKEFLLESSRVDLFEAHLSDRFLPVEFLRSALCGRCTYSLTRQPRGPSVRYLVFILVAEHNACSLAYTYLRASQRAFARSYTFGRFSFPFFA